VVIVSNKRASEIEIERGLETTSEKESVCVVMCFVWQEERNCNALMQDNQDK
jgi:hypothetical protein